MSHHSSTHALAIELPPNTGCSKTFVNQKFKFCRRFSRNDGLYFAVGHGKEWIEYYARDRRDPVVRIGLPSDDLGGSRGIALRNRGNSATRSARNRTNAEYRLCARMRVPCADRGSCMRLALRAEGRERGSRKRIRQAKSGSRCHRPRTQTLPSPRRDTRGYSAGTGRRHVRDQPTNAGQCRAGKQARASHLFDEQF